MTTEQLARLRKGDWLRWHSKLDYHVDGKITAVYADYIKVAWEDGHQGATPYATLLRHTFEPIEE